MRFANISYFLKCVLVCFILLLLRFLVFSVPTTKNGELSSSPSSEAGDDDVDRVPKFSFTRLIGNMSGSACNFEYNILVAIISAPGNVLLRKAIRSTFGSVLPVKFFVGKCREFTTGIKKALCKEKDIEKEAETLKDIVRYDFIDAYNNLTLKTFSVLDFLTRCAPFVKLLVKIDDDTFVNPIRLREVLDEAHVFPSKDTTERRKALIFGHLQREARPYRHRSSKYYISKDEYPASRFPPFVSGPLYFMNRLAVDALHRTAVEFSFHLKKSPLHLEDVFFTGFIAKAANVSLVHVNSLDNAGLSKLPLPRYLTSRHFVRKPTKMFLCWRHLLDDVSFHLKELRQSFLQKGKVDI